MLTVTPSMGNTQGVRFKSSPPTNSASSQPAPPPASAASSRLRTALPPAAGAAVAPVGALANELKPRPLAGVVPAAAPGAAGGAALEAPPAVTFTCTVNGTDVGARHTSLLHD